MPSDSPSNILREAQNLGVKVTSEKTFLTFDETLEDSNPSKPNVNNHHKRRFTTTDLIMNKELVEQLQALGTSPLKLLDAITNENDASGRDWNTADDDVRRSSVCTQMTMDYDSESKDASSMWQGSFKSLLVQTPVAATIQLPCIPSSATITSEYTTVMIRNVPNRYSQDALISFIRSLGYRFNFFYCPIDRHSRANCGYFFVNLITPSMARAFIKSFHGLQLPAFRSTKVCEACWARVQGYSANVDQYKLSPIASLPREFRPRVFKADGSEACLSFGERKVDELRIRKVFVGGLAPSTTAAAIRSHLEQFGQIEDVSIIFDSGNRAPRGFAFVTFVNPDSVSLCVQATDAHYIDGRSVGIRPYSSSKA